MAIRCSHCKHTTVHTHTHSHTGFIQSIAEQHVTHTLGLSSIHVQSLQSRGDTGPVSVQISTGGKSNQKTAWLFLFSNKMNDFCSTTYLTICEVFFSTICVVFHLCSLIRPLTPTQPTHFKITPTTWRRMTKMRPKEGRTEEKRLNVPSTKKAKRFFFFSSCGRWEKVPLPNKCKKWDLTSLQGKL